MNPIVGTLIATAKDKAVQPISAPIVGGYSNARGDVSLFGDSMAYRVDLKNKIVREHPGLNSEAQVRYDAAESGGAFRYCSAKFSRLSEPQIVAICASGPFRAAPRFV